jgi:hypothetical protein
LFDEYCVVLGEVLAANPAVSDVIWRAYTR